MRNILKRLAFAVGLVMGFTFFYQYADNHHFDPEYLYAALGSLPAVFGAFFLGDWILTGHRPWSRPQGKPIA